MQKQTPNPLPIRTQIMNGMERIFTVLEDYDPPVRDLILEQLGPEVSIRLLEAMQATDLVFYLDQVTDPLWGREVATGGSASNEAPLGS